MTIATDGFGTAYKNGEGSGGGGGGTTSTVTNTSHVPGTTASDALDGLQLAGLDAGIIRTPRLTSTIATLGGKPHTLVTGNGYLYLICFGLGGSPSKPPRLEIYDIATTPATPILKSSTSLPGLVYDLRLNGNTLWTSVYISGNARLQAWDVSDPTAPVLSGAYTTTGDQPFDVDIDPSRNLAAMACTGTNGLQFFDITSVASPALLSSTGGAFASVALKGNYAYGSDYGTGFLRVYDTTAPAAPVLVGSLSLGTDVRQLSVDGNGYCYVARRTAGTVNIVDVRVPASPTLLSTFPMPISTDEQNPIYVTGDVLMLGSTDSTPGAVYIWDVSDKTAAVLMRKISGGNQLFDAELVGSYLYVSNRTGLQELLTFQVRDESVDPQPARRSSLRTVTSATTVGPTDDTLQADATGGAFSVTLLNAAQVPGQKFTILRSNSGANAVTIATTAGQTISGAASISLSSQWSSRTVQSTGSGWIVIASI